MNLINLLPTNLQPFARKHQSSIVFVIRIFALFLLWQLLFHFMWKSEYLFDIYYAVCINIIDFILHCCEFIMSMNGMNVEVDTPTRVLRIVDTPGVTVGEPCIGIDLMAFYSALILASSGNVKKKIWYVPLGVISILFINILRIIALAVLVTIDYELWEINHIFVFTAIVYIFTFMMWYFWLKTTNKSVPNVQVKG